MPYRDWELIAIALQRRIGLLLIAQQVIFNEVFWMFLVTALICCEQKRKTSKPYSTLDLISIR